ncbi:hypothetical protein DFH08DRAFT_968050 [Mycena albidolilacea]|uniref:Uncharacterized protein n=1 Tax=Mycena albidolilacea TaxID=1033008 RepID=A0AAD6ZL68_9AGAR|nr:hypothetical protein DFH08DRAFT_968050 [Mycena albidolilacea]
MSSAPDADVATRSQRPEPATPLDIHPASPDCLQVCRRPSSPLLRVYAHIFLPPVCAAACTPTPKSRRRLTIPPALIRRLQFTDCMLKGRRRRKLNTQRCSTLPTPIPRLRLTDCIMLSAPGTLTLTPPYNVAYVLAISCDYRSCTQENVERVCPSLCPALGLSLSLLPPSFAFSPFPPRLIPSHRSLPTHCATASIHQCRLALAALPILPSTSTLFPSRLNTHPALLASGRLPRLATSPYDLPEPARRHTQVNNTATPPARPCAWDPLTQLANYSSLTYTRLKPEPTTAHALLVPLLAIFIPSSPSLPPSPRSLPLFPRSLPPSSSSIARLVSFLPWSGPERADINTTDVCYPHWCYRARERTDSQRPRKCPSPIHSASLLSSTFVPLPGAHRVSTPPPASLLSSLRVAYLFICIPSPSKSDE